MISISAEGVRHLGWKLRFLRDGIYQRELYPPLLLRLRVLHFLPLFLPLWREIDIIFRRRGGDYQRREGECGGHWRGGGSGVLQREIPSITPWASYIRDYFSFLSSFHLSPSHSCSLPFSHFLLLYLTSSSVSAPFPYSASHFPALGRGLSFKRWRRRRGPAGVPFLRNCEKLAAWCSTLRYVTSRRLVARNEARKGSFVDVRRTRGTCA